MVTSSRYSSRHCEERSDEAIQGPRDVASVTLPLDCFAEPVLGPADGGTRGLAMTGEMILFDLITL
jgi:hypothetical protein